MAINRDSECRVDIVEVGWQDTQNMLVECQFVAPGRYTALYIDDEFSMSDVGLLRAGSIEVVQRSKGNVLLVGLGLGLVVGNIMARDSVEKITVVEYVQSVCDAVGKAYLESEYGHKIDIQCASIYDWLPPEGEKYDTIWFDIWHVRDYANLPVMEELHQRFSPYLAEGGWMQSFWRAEMMDMKRQAATYVQGLMEMINDPNIPGSASYVLGEKPE